MKRLSQLVLWRLVHISPIESLLAEQVFDMAQSRSRNAHTQQPHAPHSLALVLRHHYPNTDTNRKVHADNRLLTISENSKYYFSLRVHSPQPIRHVSSHHLKSRCAEDHANDSLLRDGDDSVPPRLSASECQQSKHSRLALSVLSLP